MIISKIKIVHGLYDVIYDRIYWRNVDYFEIPIKFRVLIIAKGKKWNRKKNQSYSFIPFAIGKDGDILAIAIVHPWDILKFKQKISEDIITGRIKRQLGLIDRPTYDTVPMRDEDGMIMTDDEGKILFKEVPPYIITGNLK